MSIENPIDMMTEAKRSGSKDSNNYPQAQRHATHCDMLERKHAKQSYHDRGNYWEDNNHGEGVINEDEAH